MGFATWNEAVTVARDRADWGRQVQWPYSPRGELGTVMMMRTF